MMTAPLKETKAVLSRIESSLSRFDRGIGLAVFRIITGLNVLYFFYINEITQAPFIWGNNGAIPYPVFVALSAVRRDWSFYLISPDERFHVLLYFCGIVVTILFTLGLFTRVSTILFYAFTWSLYSRNPILMTGGDNLLYLLAFYLMFTDAGRSLSLDALLGFRKSSSRFVALFHQVAVVVLLSQVAIVYGVSAFFKIQGHMWQDGTAIYYILRSNEFALDSWTHFIYNNAVLVTILTNGTFLFQMAFPFLIFHKTLKWLVIPIALSFHIGIAICMGLVSFSITMIAAEALFLTDNDYRLIASKAQAVWAWLSHRSYSNVSAPSSAGAVLSPE